MGAHGPERGGERAARPSPVAARSREDLPVALAADLLPELLCTEARATLTLRREDGRDEPPRIVEETGCRIEGPVMGRPCFAVIDRPDAALTTRLARRAGSEAPLEIPDVEPLVAQAFSWAVPIREAMGAMDSRGLPRESGVLGIRWEARISLGAVRIARRPSIPLPAVPEEESDAAASLPRSHIEIRTSVTLQRRDRIARGEAACWLDPSSSPRPGSLEPARGLVDEAVRRAADRLEAVTLPALEAPVVFSPSASGVLFHEVCGHLLEGDLIAARTSPFAGRLGERLAPPAVTILDDPRSQGGRIHMRIDDEGEGTTAKLLLEQGRLAGYLTDRRTAAALGGVSTGNGRRESYRQGALPRMTNLVMIIGEEDPGDLLRGITRGIRVERLGRGQVDPRLGRFRLEVEAGRLIEGGRLTHTVAGGWLAGSCLDLLAAIEGIGSDPEVDRAAGLCIKEDQILPVGQCFPSLRVGRMKIHPGAAP